MPTLENIQGSSLIADLSGALDRGIAGFREEEEREREEEKQRDIEFLVEEIGDPARTQQQVTQDLSRLAILDADAANNVMKVRASRNKNLRDQARFQAQQNAIVGNFVNEGKTVPIKRNKLDAVIQFNHARGIPVDELVRIKNLTNDDEFLTALEINVAKGQLINKTLATEKEHVLSPGQELFRGGKRIAGVPAENRAPQIREVKKGPDIITEQFDPATGTFFEIGRAPAAQPRQPTPPLSPEAFEQQQKLAATKAKSDVNKLVESQIKLQEFNAQTPAARAKQTLLDQKVAQGELNKQKREMQKEAKDAKAKLIEGKVNEAIALADKWLTTGFLGQMLSMIGGTDARSLRSVIDTIQANLGFAELQAMRDASPTGGALGQVALRELDLLQATIASLDQGLDDDVLIENLNQITRHIQNWKSAVDQTGQQNNGDALTKSPTEMTDQELLEDF